jgi:hypothetical protein
MFVIPRSTTGAGTGTNCHAIDRDFQADILQSTQFSCELLAIFAFFDLPALLFVSSGSSVSFLRAETGESLTSPKYAPASLKQNIGVEPTEHCSSRVYSTAAAI